MCPSAQNLPQLSTSSSSSSCRQVEPIQEMSCRFCVIIFMLCQFIPRPVACHRLQMLQCQTLQLLRWFPLSSPQSIPQRRCRCIPFVPILLGRNVFEMQKNEEKEENSIVFSCCWRAETDCCQLISRKEERGTNSNNNNS